MTIVLSLTLKLILVSPGEINNVSSQHEFSPQSAKFILQLQYSQTVQTNCLICHFAPLGPERTNYRQT